MEEKQKKPVYKKWWFWLIVILVIGAIGSSMGEESDTTDKQVDKQVADSKESEAQEVTEETTEEETEEETEPEETEEKTEEPEFYKVGEIAETDKVKATITEITKPKGGEFNKPAEGKEFVLVNITIENISEDKELNISSILGFNAYVDDVSINENLSAQIEADNTMDGTIVPGKKLTGTLGYEVPEDWKEIEVYFEPDVWDDVKIQWVIENK